ncbi:cbb3-type cytochrome c oxidase subunit I, partial [Corynebacterium parakroppenstedtii]|uniref:cbb3-type cytochrome c oxidase subunit I n=1 Tax=Corynebacterium parakroppenstedtii TaxID=2828363 RepID=UPI001F01A7A5
MTAVAPRVDDYVAPTRPEPTGNAKTGSKAWVFLTTTDHKQLGIMYLIMSFSFFFLGGFMALLIRAELFTPGLQFLSNEQFNQLFTMHGTVMLLGFVTPGGAADFGWTMYMPLADGVHTPGIGADMWIVGVGATGVGTIASAVNMSTTILTLRAPGMTMFRLPVFSWAVFTASA